MSHVHHLASIVVADFNRGEKKKENMYREKNEDQERKIMKRSKIVYKQ